MADDAPDDSLIDDSPGDKVVNGDTAEDEESDLDNRDADEQAAVEAWPHAKLVLAVLIAVTVVAVAIGAWLWWAAPESDAMKDEGRRQEALSAATGFANAMTSFSADDVEAYGEDLNARLVDGDENPCWEQIAAFVPAVGDPAAAEAATKQKAVYEGSVLDRGVETIDPDSADVAVAIDYAIEAELKEQPTTVGSGSLRLRLDLAEEDDDWMVNDCTIVQPEPVEDE